MPAFKDLTGKKFQMLTVVSRAPNLSRRARWNCICECGNPTVVAGHHLSSGACKSCGCLHRPHGMTGTPEFKAWSAMISRCHIRSSGNYYRYGAVGITVCERWRTNFKNFYADMGAHPGKGYSVDRIDSSGNYEPGNCRWATKEQQARNRRVTKLTEESVKEIRKSYTAGSRVPNLAAMFGVSTATIYKTLSGLRWVSVVAIMLLFMCSIGAQSQTTVAPFLTPQWQFFDNSGAVCSGCLLSTFAAGTTTPLATYSESTGTTLNANPVVLSSAGTATVYLTAASYKFVLKTAAGATIRTQDNVTWVSPLTSFSGLSDAGAFDITQPTAATGVANQSSFSSCLHGTYWTGAASADDKWCFQDVLGSGSNPSSTLNVTHSGSSGSATVSWPSMVFSNLTVSGLVSAGSLSTSGNATIGGVATLTGGAALPSGGVINWNSDTGLSRDAAGIIDIGNGSSGNKSGGINLATITATGNVNETTGQNQYKAYTINSVLWVDGIKYTTLAGCYADIPANGGICMVPPNYSETLGASLTLSKNNAGFQFTGPALITMGSNQVVINQSVTGAFIFGQVPTGAVVVTSTDVTGTAGVTFVYTGSGTAFSVGGAAANPVVGLRLENFTIDISGAGTNAIGLDLLNVHGGGFIRALNIHGTGPTGAAQSQVGIQTDDGGGFTGDITFDTVQVIHVKTGILFNGQSQEITMLGCQFWGGAASSTAIDIEALWGIQAWGGNIDNYTTSVKMGGSAGNNFIAMPMGNFTTTANFGASTLRNTVQVARNTAPVISDSGTLNNVVWSGQRQNGMINAQGPSGALTGNSADQTVFTYSIPAGTIAAGRGIRVSWTVNHTTGAANIAYKLVLGSTTLFTSTSTTASTATYQGQIQIMNAAGVQNSQFLWGFIFDSTTLLNDIATVTSAENTANALVLKLTFNVANTNQVTPTAWMVELI